MLFNFFILYNFVFYIFTEECDFEAGFCEWTQDNKDNFNWEIGQNGTVTEGTGPQFDHTTQTEIGKIKTHM